MASLVRPTETLLDSYVAAIEEFQGEGRYLGVDTRLLVEPGRFRAYVDDKLGAETAVRPSGGYRVLETVLWYVEGTTFIGHVSIRHTLTEWLFDQGGHIGYDVRPTARRRGHASAMLEASLPVALQLGINPALVTCLATNIPSRKVIEACGGVFDDERVGRLRYWLATDSAASRVTPARGR